MSASGPEAMGTAAKVWHRCRCAKTDGGAPMPQVDDLSRSLIAFEQNSTMVVVLEMSQSSWMAAGVVPGIERRPLKKLDPDPPALLRLVEGWRDHARKAGRIITRIVLASRPAGIDSGWLVGCALAVSRLLSSIRRASQCHASIAGQRRIVSTPKCSFVCS